MRSRNSSKHQVALKAARPSALAERHMRDLECSSRHSERLSPSRYRNRPVAIRIARVGKKGRHDGGEPHPHTSWDVRTTEHPDELFDVPGGSRRNESGFCSTPSASLGRMRSGNKAGASPERFWVSRIPFSAVRFCGFLRSPRSSDSMLLRQNSRKIEQLQNNRTCSGISIGRTMLFRSLLLFGNVVE